MQHEWGQYFDTESDYWKKVQKIYEENDKYEKVVVKDRELHHKFLRSLSKKEGVDVDNDPDNLVSLSLPDHLRVHYYLYKCTKKGFRNITGFPVRFMLKKAIGSISDETFEMIARDYDVVHLKHTEETRKKMSKSHKGKHPSEESRKRMSKAQKGRHHPEEAKRKMSETHKGMKQSKETKRKMSEAHHKKKVLCVETGEIFDSVRDATRKTGISSGGISEVCRGKRSKAGGYHWTFCE